MATVQLKAVSKASYPASADERQRFGGEEVTEFYVTRLDKDETRVFTGSGETLEDRKVYALAKAAEFWKLKGGPKLIAGANYYVWVATDEPLKEGPQGPYGFRQAKDLGRIGAMTSEYDTVVTEGNDPTTFKLLRRYEAVTGKILVRK